MHGFTIEAENLEVSYGRRVALSLQSLRVRGSAGVVGLFGPNGAGKSTLLRTIVGDIAAYKGDLDAPSRNDIAYLPDAPFLYPWLKVRDCSRLFASRHADYRPEILDAFLAGSNVKSGSRVGELSKGMSERLHLALIMSRAPKLYALDEPLGGVDPLARDHLLGLIQQLRIPEAPLLLSTHMINGVDAIFDEILLIDDGRLLAHDTAEQLREFGDGDLELAYKRSLAGS